MNTEKVTNIFKFLSASRKYNKAVQNLYYESVILSVKNSEDKIIALLHSIANTQSQPKIDNLAKFFKEINKYKNKLSSFKGLVSILAQTNTIDIPNYSDVFDNLQNKDGWGNKTAALFVKSIYHIHNGQYGRELKVWNDAPINIIDDKFYLPVDSVIEFIFSKLDLGIKNNFKGINDYLSNNYSTEEIEIWDDLWFWGFITQKGGGTNRKLEWNENKYWALLHTSKDEHIINEIKKKANIFIELLNA